MAMQTTRTPELTLPIASLAAMHVALVEAAGAETAASALRQAGHAAGDALLRILSSSQDAADLPADRFWSDFSRLFASRGWGQLTFSHMHAGVGALDAADWAESLPDSGVEQPCCHFTTGMLANLLGSVVGTEVAVLEVECRSRGDQRCRFLFGGEAAVFAVYDRMASGADAGTAVSQLA